MDLKKSWYSHCPKSRQVGYSIHSPASRLYITWLSPVTLHINCPQSIFTDWNSKQNNVNIKLNMEQSHYTTLQQLALKPHLRKADQHYTNTLASDKTHRILITKSMKWTKCFRCTLLFLKSNVWQNIMLTENRNVKQFQTVVHMA